MSILYFYYICRYNADHYFGNSFDKLFCSPPKLRELDFEEPSQ